MITVALCLYYWWKKAQSNCRRRNWIWSKTCWSITSFKTDLWKGLHRRFPYEDWCTWTNWQASSGHSGKSGVQAECWSRWCCGQHYRWRPSMKKENESTFEWIMTHMILRSIAIELKRIELTSMLNNTYLCMSGACPFVSIWSFILMTSISSFRDLVIK